MQVDGEPWMQVPAEVSIWWNSYDKVKSSLVKHEVFWAHFFNPDATYRNTATIVFWRSLFMCRSISLIRTRCQCWWHHLPDMVPSSLAFKDQIRKRTIYDFMKAYKSLNVQHRCHGTKLSTYLVSIEALHLIHSFGNPSCYESLSFYRLPQTPVGETGKAIVDLHVRFHCTCS